MQEAAREPVLVDLALQGGGSHGAFTWGVLDRLIEEPWLRIEAISGTSAGAMNAALVARGAGWGGFRPLAALAARRAEGPLDPRHVPRLCRHGPDGPRAFAL